MEKINELDVVKLKNGKEATVLIVHPDGNLYVEDRDDETYEVELSEVKKIVWKFKAPA